MIEIIVLKLKILKEDIKTIYLKEMIKIKTGIIEFFDRIL